MAKLPFLTLNSTVDNLRTTTNNLNDLIGDLALLNTAGDSDLVQAINYVDSDTNARIDSADTYFKARIASEVNTLNNIISDGDSDLNSLISEVSTRVGALGSLSTSNKSSIVLAINELDSRIDLLDSANVTGSILALEDRADSNDANFVTRVRGSISAEGAGSFTYNSSTGVFTYTGPSASEVRAYFSEGEGIDISSGVISGEDASTTNKGIASFNSSRFSVSSGAVDIADNGIINSKLANSSFTVNGVAVSLGQNITANMSVYNIYPATHNTYDLGTSGTRFRTMYAGTFNGTATSAQYADLAEKYLADEDYPVGTVMSVGGVGEVTATTMYSGHSILGVVSENPAFMMNEGLVGGTYIALKGRVPVRITGQVRKGDRLAPSPIRGVAHVDNDRAAWSFAIALHDTKEGEDTVEAVIL